MIDLREHRAVIREAVAIERRNDPYYSWSIKSITKTRALIRWGYLSENECFEIELAPCGPGCACIFGHDPHNNFYGIGFSLGNAPTDDFEMFEVDKALAACVREIAREAHHLY